MTPAEKKLWHRIRKGQLKGRHFRKQHAVGNYIVDFFCTKSKLVIEVDGDSHADRVEYDARRTQWLSEEKGYLVIRFTNNEIYHNIDVVLKQILKLLDSCSAHL